MDNIIRHEYCRAGGGKLTDLITLGDICLNGFPAEGEADPPKFPLTLAVGEHSGLVQLRHTLNSELLYRDYWYESGINESMVAHLSRVAQSVYDYVDLEEGDAILDIGCNDGTLLSNFSKDLYRVGIDPSNIHPDRGSVDFFINDFFENHQFINDYNFKAIFSIAMFYDLDDPVQFAKDVASILTNDGVWVIEMHYLPKMLEMNDIGAICHEHLCYYSFESIQFVLEQANLYIVDAKMNDVNGGSMRIYVRKATHLQIPSMSKVGMDSIPTTFDSRVDVFNLIQKERTVIDYDAFVENVFRNKEEMLELLKFLQDQGKIISGYGASTKGNTVLQYFGIGKDLLPAIADRNPRKWGRHTPGTHIPIISEEYAREIQPDYFFALPYHFIESFIAREHEFIDRGGRFIVPFPQPGVVTEWD